MLLPSGSNLEAVLSQDGPVLSQLAAISDHLESNLSQPRVILWPFSVSLRSSLSDSLRAILLGASGLQHGHMSAFHADLGSFVEGSEVQNHYKLECF